MMKIELIIRNLEITLMLEGKPQGGEVLVAISITKVS